MHMRAMITDMSDQTIIDCGQKSKTQKHDMMASNAGKDHGYIFAAHDTYFLSCVARLTRHTRAIVTPSIASFDYQRMPDHE